MKKSKKILLTILCMSTLAMGLGGTAALGISYAEEKDHFIMVEGASIRLNENGSGIRYMAELSEDVVTAVQADVNKQFDIAIFPAEYLDAIEYYYGQDTENVYGSGDYIKDMNSLVELNKISSPVVIENCVPVQDIGKNGNYYYIKGSIVNILYENINRDFAGIAYIKTTNAETNAITYEYAAFKKDQVVRSVSEVANKAKIGGEEGAILDKYLSWSVDKASGLAEAAENSATISVEFSDEIVKIGIQKTREMAATVIATYGDEEGKSVNVPVAYESSDPSICRVDKNGKITGVAEGDATITASFGGVSDTLAVTVASCESLSGTIAFVSQDGSSFDASKVSMTIDGQTAGYRLNDSVYTIPDLLIGEHIVSLSYTGYRTVEKAINLTDENKTLDFVVDTLDVYFSYTADTTNTFADGKYTFSSSQNYYNTAYLTKNNWASNWYMEFDVSEIVGTSSVWGLFGVQFAKKDNKSRGVAFGYDTSATTPSTSDWAGWYRVIWKNGVTDTSQTNVQYSNQTLHQSVLNAGVGVGRTVKVAAIRLEDRCYFYFDDILVEQFSMKTDFGFNGDQPFGIMLNQSSAKIANCRYAIDEAVAKAKLAEIQKTAISSDDAKNSVVAKDNVITLSSIYDDTSTNTFGSFYFNTSKAYSYWAYSLNVKVESGNAWNYAMYGAQFAKIEGHPHAISTNFNYMKGNDSGRYSVIWKKDAGSVTNTTGLSTELSAKIYSSATTAVKMTAVRNGEDIYVWLDDLLLFSGNIKELYGFSGDQKFGFFLNSSVVGVSNIEINLGETATGNVLASMTSSAN